ncbi:auxin-responsive protein SAUR32-like [Thalictrum thalictroides]|uniref:Auxin-responsive protein SAUR32-like n=1 Tax=Thalictrum thalictroides TaxID=46969 RepID=A0A7J6X529_THATH|nr:auxin-responsive protein SAUR32-like [Thalictrum thalictroides]
MKKRLHCILKLKHAVQKLQSVLLSLVGWKFIYCQHLENRISIVKKGYFAVFTMKDNKPKKFLVSLNYLAHPAFVKLLEKTEQEFGFDQPGVLVVPCQANELQSILSDNSVSSN